MKWKFNALFLHILILIFCAVNANAQDQFLTKIKGDTVGLVNGRPILKAEYVTMFNDVKDQIGKKDFQKLSDQELDDIHKKTWDNLVLSLAIEDSIRIKGITASDQEIRAILENNPPAFMKRQFIDSMGVFDSIEYSKALRDHHNDSLLSSIIINMRTDFQRQKLFEQLQKTIPPVTDEELWNDYKQQKGATKKEFEKDKPQLKDQAMQARAQIFFQHWVESVRTSAKVVDFRSMK